jgi:hypothetical protein
MSFVYTDNPDALDNDQTWYVVVDPTINNKLDLIDFLTDTLEFPGRDYSWDALYSYLRDFSWMQERRVLLYHPELPLERELSRADYLQILNFAADAWINERAGERELIVAFSPHLQPEVERLLTLDTWEGPPEGRLISGYRPEE